MSEKIETNIFDKVEYQFCVDIQILTNSVTGEQSIGWARPGSEISERWHAQNGEESQT